MKQTSRAFDDPEAAGEQDINEIKNQLHELSERNQHLEQERMYFEDRIRRLEDADSRVY